MARTDGAIKSLGFGVSTLHEYQQTQPFAKEQINFRTDSVKGLTRRQSAEWVTITGKVDDLIIDYDRDSVLPITVNNQDYWAIFRPARTTWLLIDSQGHSYDTAFGEGARAYVDGAKPGDLSHTTSNEVTLIASRLISPAMDSTLVRENGNASMIHIKTAAPTGQVISITFDINEGGSRTTVNYTVPAGRTVANQAADVSALMAAAAPLCTVTWIDATVIAYGTAWDGYLSVATVGYNDYLAINGTVKAATDLPASAPWYEIVGVQTSGSEDAMYYLRAEGEEGTGAPPDVPIYDYVALQTGHDPDHQSMQNQGGAFEVDIFYFTGEWDNVIANRYFEPTLVLAPTVDRPPEIYARNNADRVWDTSGTVVSFTGFYYVSVNNSSNPLEDPRYTACFILSKEPDAKHNPQVMTITAPGLPTVSGEVSEITDFVSEIASEICYGFPITRDQYIDLSAAYQNDTNAVTTTITRSEGTEVFVEGDEVTTMDNVGVATPGVIWRETSKPGDIYKLDPYTMPHAIAYDKATALWQFARIGTFGTAEWTERNAGSNKSNPFHMTDPIKDMALFQGRLMTVTGAYVNLSGTDNIFNFFQQSFTLGVLANDPIQVGSTIAQEVDFEYLIAHNGSVVVFNSVGQFKLGAEEAITPSNAALPKTSGYPYTAKCRPTSNGVALYFPHSSGTSSAIHELSIDANRDSFETARALTNAVPNYIQGDTSSITVDTLLNLVAVHAKDRKRIYVADIVTESNGYARHSWNEWVFREDVAQSRRVGAKLQLLGSTNGLLTLNNVALRTVQGVLLTDIRLDYTTYATFTEPTSQYQLPVNIPMRTILRTVVAGPDTETPGAPLGHTVDANGLVTLDEPIIGTVITGLPFTSSFIPGTVHVRDASGYIQRGAKLRIIRYECILEDTGYLAAQMISRHYNFPIREYYGTLNSQMIFDDVNINDNYFQIPFKQDSTLADIRLFTRDHTPATIVGMEWQGGYNKRGRRF